MAEEERDHYGMAVHQGDDGTRVEMECVHQSGVLYAVPADASWVCAPDLRHVHSLAGFLKDLTALDDPRVHELMQKWGLYFRPRPVAGQAETES